MNQRLNIPFEVETTRRNNWRVVSLLAIFGASVLFWVLIQQIWLAKDTTSSLRPPETVYSVHISLTPRVKSIISENAGSDTLIPNAPWTIDDAIGWSNNEITLHYGNNGILAVSIDNPLPNEVLETKSDFGLYFGNNINENASYISTTPTIDTQNYEKTFNIVEISPFNTGFVEFHEYQEKFAFKINKERVIIHGSGGSTDSRQLNLPENTVILAQVHIQNPETFSTFTTVDPGIDAFTRLLNNQDAFLTLFSDQKGIGYDLMVYNSEIELDDLVTLGNEILSRKTLSTTAWTIDNETTVYEITSNKEDITTEINTIESLSTIKLYNSNGDIIRIAKSDESITISNRDLSLRIQENTTQATCGNADNFVRPQELIQTLPYQIDPSNPAFHFYEIGIKKRKTILCW